ncbi:hypothetical protein LCGC14_0371550 [marine sediment metagenome]|uniref:Uncharacterized protein n=1 Tax=marine sediment metagenome TaxID=412755 RepID=A0A0F9WDL0_9ZZZZ
MKFEEYMKTRSEIIERMLWIGCNPDNPDLFKEQSEEGFKLMGELNNLTKQFINDNR